MPPTTTQPPERAELPATVGAWTRSGAPERVDRAAIFDYMNGAGELYLAYRFDHLDVTTYTAEGEAEILVERYWMQQPEDAWGLLSDDWGGEHVALGEHFATDRALYGAGLLRIACDALFVRILTYREDEASRRAVLALGAAVVSGRQPSPVPAQVAALPPTVAAGGQRYALQPDSMRLLRSELVLNAAFYLASGNLLALDTTAAAAFAEYRRDPRDPATRVRALTVRYADADRAEAACRRFVRGYLADPAERVVGAAGRDELYRIEDGWTGFRRSGRDVALVFGAPDAEVADALLAAIEQR